MSDLLNRSGDFQRYATNDATNETVTSKRLRTAVLEPFSAGNSGQLFTGDFQRYATNDATNETAVFSAVATNEIEPPAPPPRKRITPTQTNKRIEIKAHELADGGKGLYWRWRWQENGRRRSSYGGTISSLANKERISQYRRNSSRYWRRIKENGTQEAGDRLTEPIGDRHPVAAGL